MFHTVHIGIGSNQGDRLANCRRALELLGSSPGIVLGRCSPWYESAAVPVAGGPQGLQPAFINGAAELSTSLDPQALLAALQGIETSMGRSLPRTKGEARAIDLDLLLYNSHIIREPELTVPHPELAKRPFVLIPLCAIAADTVEPVSGCTVRELAERFARLHPQAGVTQVA